MITKDMPLEEVLVMVNDYIFRASDFYATYDVAVKSLTKALDFTKDFNTSHYIKKDIEAYEKENEELVNQYEPLLITFIYYVFNHPLKEAIFISKIENDEDNGDYHYEFTGEFGEPLGKLLELEVEFSKNFELYGFLNDVPRDNLINSQMTPAQFIKAIKKYSLGDFDFKKATTDNKKALSAYKS